MSSAIVIILVLGLLIFFHELGHFAVARLFNMGVMTFSIGFGPKLLKWKPKKTEYAISLIPLGGYVALVGEAEDDIPEGFTEEDSFQKRPAWQRFFVVLAGPIANLVLAWFLFWGIAYVNGTPIILPDVGAVKEGSAAEEAGILPNDRIVSIGGTPVASWRDISPLVNASKGEPMRVEIQRCIDGLTSVNYSIELSARKMMRKTIFGEEESAWIVGITPANHVLVQEEGLFSSARAGLRSSWDMISLTWQGFVKLVQRVVPADQLGGPIMIAQLVAQQAKEGIANVLGLAALISINLGILNLLPIPVLDGGAIVFCLIEMVIGRPVNKTVQEYALRVGIVLLVALMIFATYNDIVRLFKS